jgi:hypothetical protein
MQTNGFTKPWFLDPKLDLLILMVPCLSYVLNFEGYFFICLYKLLHGAQADEGYHMM